MATAFDLLFWIIGAEENRRLGLNVYNRPHSIATWVQFHPPPPAPPSSLVTSKLKWHYFSCSVINGLTPPRPRCHLKVVTLLSLLYTLKVIITHLPCFFFFFYQKEKTSTVTPKDPIGYNCKDLRSGCVSHEGRKPQNNVCGEERKIAAPNQTPDYYPAKFKKDSSEDL